MNLQMVWNGLGLSGHSSQFGALGHNAQFGVLQSLLSQTPQEGAQHLLSLLNQGGDIDSNEVEAILSNPEIVEAIRTIYDSNQKAFLAMMGNQNQLAGSRKFESPEKTTARLKEVMVSATEQKQSDNIPLKIEVNLGGVEIPLRGVGELTIEHLKTLLRSIVTRDYTIYGKDGDASKMSTDGPKFNKKYDTGVGKIALQRIWSMWNNLSGTNYRHSEIVKIWQKEVFGVVIDDSWEKAYKIEVDLGGVEIPTVGVGILTIGHLKLLLRAMVRQDLAIYGENGDASKMSTSNHKFRKKYDTGVGEVSPARIYSLWNMLSGTNYQRSEIVKIWQKEVFNVEKDLFKIEVDLDGVKIPAMGVGRLTIVHLKILIRAIVRQDHSIYGKDGDASKMRSSANKFHKKYDTGVGVVSLDRIHSLWNTLSGTNYLKSKIVKMWQKEIFGIEIKKVDKQKTLKIEVDLGGVKIPAVGVGKLTIAHLKLLLRAIVTQDDTIYGKDGDALKMSAEVRKFLKRYETGFGEVSPARICGLWNELLGTNYKRSEIVKMWQKEVFNVKKDLFKIEVNLDGVEIPKKGVGKLTIEHLKILIRAIVTQDYAIYGKNGDATKMKTSPEKFDKRYETEVGEVSLARICGLWNELSGTNYKRSEIVKIWQEEILNMKDNLFRIAVDLDGVKIPAVGVGKLTIEHLKRLLIAMVSQDSVIYGKNGDAAKMKTSREKFSKRYDTGVGTISLLRIWALWNALSGASYSRGEMIKIWQKEVFGINAGEIKAEEFEDWVKENDVADVVELLKDIPDALEEFVRILNPEIRNHQVVRIMRAFVELRLSEGWKPLRINESMGVRVDPLIRALMSRREVLDQLASDEDKFNRVVDVMYRRWEKAFNRNPEETLGILNGLISEVEDNRIKLIIEETALRFMSADELYTETIATKMKPYQKVGATFLSDNKSAILADEPGLGKTLQTISAVEVLRMRRNGKLKALVICPATVKATWAKQLSTNKEGGHLNETRKVVMVDGNVESKRIQSTNAKNADYVIVNYEYLVGLQKGIKLAREAGDKRTEKLLTKEWDNITSGVDVKIVDEAQMVQNPSEEVQRGEAVRKIESEYKWYLSATPYFGRVEHIWTHLNDLESGKHGTLREFRSAYAKDESGLIMMNRLLKGLMLRRLKKNVIGTYDKTKSLESQNVLLPEMQRIEPIAEGRYEISDEQTELSLLFLRDFESFWDTYGDGIRLAEDINPLLRLELFSKITHEPQVFGINGIENKYSAMDAIIVQRAKVGKKIVIYTKRRDEAKLLKMRYEGQGYKADTYMGGISLNKKEEIRNKFQDGDTQILIGTEAMMLGIDLSAADLFVFAQMPWTYSEEYQLQDRLSRLDPEHKKYEVEIIHMMGAYPELGEFDIEDQIILKKGSYDELKIRNLELSRQVFDTVMDLPYAYQRVEKLLQEKALTGIFGKQQGHKKKLVDAGDALYPLYVKARSLDEELQERGQIAVMKLMQLYAGRKSSAKELLEVYKKHTQSEGFPVEEAELIGKLLDVRNKHLRRKIIDDLPNDLNKLHDKHQTLDEVIKEGEAIDVLGWLLGKDDAENNALDVLFNQIWKIRNIEESEKRAEKLLSVEQSMLKLMAVRGAISEFISANRDMLMDIDVCEFVDVLERLSEIQMGSGDLFEMVMEEEYSSVKNLQETLEAMELEPYYELLEINIGRNKREVKKLRAEGLGGILEAVRGYKRAKNMEKEVDGMKEIVGELVSGTFAKWRDNGADGAIKYMENEKVFWDEFNMNEIDVLKVEDGVVDVNAEIKSSWEEITELLLDRADNKLEDNNLLESRNVWKHVGEYLSLENINDKKRYFGNVRRIIQALKRSEARIKSGDDITIEDKELLATVGFNGEFSDDSYLEKAKGLMLSLSVWLEGLYHLELGISENQKSNLERALGTFSYIGNKYRGKLDGKKDAIAAVVMQIALQLRYRHKKHDGKQVVIEDTSDWRVLINIGKLHPELINCLVPSGDVKYTKALHDLLGSRNKRLLIVRDKKTNEVLSVAVLKVRQDEKGWPVLHLEKPFGRIGVKYEAQMLEHIKKKKISMGERWKDLKITKTATSKKKREEGITLYSTGSVGRFEHSEDLFDVWTEKNIKHKAEIVEE